MSHAKGSDVNITVHQLSERGLSGLPTHMGVHYYSYFSFVFKLGPVAFCSFFLFFLWNAARTLDTPILVPHQTRKPVI